MFSVFIRVDYNLGTVKSVIKNIFSFLIHSYLNYYHKLNAALF